VLALSALLYESESGTFATKDANRIKSAVISYLRTVIGCTRLGNINSEDIRK
jgi:hypothetical protein